MSGACAVREVDPAVTRPLRQAVLRPHETLEELAAHEAPGAVWLAVLDADGVVVGTGSTNPEGGPGVWRIRAMATAAEHRGRGVGSTVLAALLARIEAEGGTRAWCNARTPALSLYLRAGFAVESETFELDRIGPHVVVGREVG